MAISLDILKERAIREAERKNELDFYNELLLGNIKNRENIISQARQFGLNATGRYFVILVELNKESIYYGKAVDHGPELNKEDLEKRLYRLLHYALEKENSEGVIVEALGSLVMLLRVPDKLDEESRPDYCKKLMLKIKETLRDRMDGVPICMASGDCCEDIERISSGYLEAWETIDIGKKLYNRDFALAYSDMASYLLVKRYLTSSGAKELYERIFEPLLQYDREKGGELVQTLEVYLECNFSRTKTAEKLHLHRNSLNYRLQKIEELLEQDIDHLDTFPLLLASISRRLSQ